MKKLYTLLALAALTLSASAARHTLAPVAAADKDAATMVKSSLNVTPALARQAMSEVRAMKAQAPAAGPNFVGITCGYGYPDGLSGSSGWDTMTLTKVTTDGTKATIQNFPFNGITIEGTYDAAAGTITCSGEFEGQVSVYDALGNETTVNVVAYATDLTSFAVEDFVLTYDAETRELLYEAPTVLDPEDGKNYYVQILWVDEDRAPANEQDDITMGAFYVVQTNEYNSYITYTINYASGPGENTGFVYVEEPVDGVVEVFNPCSMIFTRQIFELPAMMELNLEDATASIADYMAAQASVSDFYQFWNADLSDTVADFSLMNLVDEASGEPFSVAVCPLLPLGFKAQGQFSGINLQNYILEFPYLLDLGGVANIALDENAPVEYFNLQGVRVENPAAGLFIRRQGATATKVLVK